MKFCVSLWKLWKIFAERVFAKKIAKKNAEKMWGKCEKKTYEILSSNILKQVISIVAYQWSE